MQTIFRILSYFIRGSIAARCFLNFLSICFLILDVQGFVRLSMSFQLFELDFTFIQYY